MQYYRIIEYEIIPNVLKTPGYFLALKKKCFQDGWLKFILKTGNNGLIWRAGIETKYHANTVIEFASCGGV